MCIIFSGCLKKKQSIKERGLIIKEECVHLAFKIGDAVQTKKSAKKNNLNGKTRGFQEVQLFLRKYPINNKIYAINASSTNFFLFQFISILKYLESPQNRLEYNLNDQNEIYKKLKEVTYG